MGSKNVVLIDTKGITCPSAALNTMKSLLYYRIMRQLFVIRCTLLSRIEGQRGSKEEGCWDKSRKGTNRGEVLAALEVDSSQSII